MLAFVRVPKTASSSLIFMQKEGFLSICDGVDNLKFNDECLIKHSSTHYINKKYCMFCSKTQHISASCYKKLHSHDHLFYTQIRDPYDVACSLYFFLKRIGNNFKIIGSNIDVDINNSYLVNNGASIDDFLENMIHNKTFTHYYDLMNIQDFDCIGYANELKKTSILLQKVLNANTFVNTLNVNPNKKILQPYNFKFSRQEFEKLNENEYKIFNDGLNKFNKLCKKYVLV